MFVLSLFLLVGCTTTDPYEVSLTEVTEDTELGYVDGTDENSDEALSETEENRMVFAPYWLPFIQVSEEMRSMMLEDFDYLVEIMLENAPTLGVFERRFGLTLEDALADIRETIYNLEPVDSFDSAGVHDIATRHLFRLLEWFGMRVERLGHFGPVDAISYREWLELTLAFLHQSEIIDGRLILDGEDFGDAESFQLRVDSRMTEATLRLYDVDLNHLDLYRELSRGFQVAGNVTTEILEENRIAYIRINSFLNNPTFDSDILFPFFDEVQEFEHLIIDLRGNSGGFPIYFEYYVVAMLINSPIEVRFNEFFTSGTIARQTAELSLEGSITGALADEILLAHDFINEQTFPYFNETDLNILTHMIPWHLKIEPRENNIPFAGEIWLLVNERSTSASELAAMISIYSGFATVVGVPTGRITPAMTIEFALPNTGILFRVDTGYLIDDLGRSLEEFGVTPDIIIERGSNALNVVLDLID